MQEQAAVEGRCSQEKSGEESLAGSHQGNLETVNHLSRMCLGRAREREHLRTLIIH